ncbi:MAG: hypothetical protein HC902_03500 [Calothrix sp. SM1_5_4]|nr:hypothetical protein [Calothrix sp. SM1_5_4]
MKKIGQLVEELGLNEAAPASTKRAFLRHLIGSSSPASAENFSTTSEQPEKEAQLSFDEKVLGVAPFINKKRLNRAILKKTNTTLKIQLRPEFILVPFWNWQGEKEPNGFGGIFKEEGPRYPPYKNNCVSSMMSGGKMIQGRLLGVVSILRPRSHSQPMRRNFPRFPVNT